MTIRHADRLWMLGGAVAAVLLLALSWFLAIAPAYNEARDFRSQAAATDVQLVSLRGQLAELEKEKQKLPASRATLKTFEAALPSDSGVPDFLRQLQTSGDQVGVKVSGVNVGAPERSTAVPNIFQLPITLTADGTAAKLASFLTQLQTTQPRAVLIETASLSSAAANGDGDMSVSISLLAFVAPNREKIASTD